MFMNVSNIFFATECFKHFEMDLQLFLNSLKHSKMFETFINAIAYLYMFKTIWNGKQLF